MPATSLQHRPQRANYEYETTAGPGQGASRSRQDVAPVAQTFFASADVQARLQLDAVVCVCDASRLKTLLVDGVEAH